MPRIRQNADKYAAVKFRKAIDHGMIDRGIRNITALAGYMGKDARTIYRKLENPEKLTVSDLRGIIRETGIGIEAIAELLQLPANPTIPSN